MSVTTPQGFLASGVAAGLKTGGAKDVALVVNTGPISPAAGVFTANRVQAAPVRWSRQVLAGGDVRTVVLNSGGANACTGPRGFQDTHRTAEAAAAATRVSASQVAVCSTGLIGVHLPMPQLLSGVEQAASALAPDGGPDAAHAIMTTDSVAKQVAVQQQGWSVGGMAKGAGMLAPELATMLVVLTTDAVAEVGVLDHALRYAVARTFDRIDSDGCMSTNDTVLLLASGASGERPTGYGLTQAVLEACDSLARQLISDAEGASKEVLIEVVRAASEADAMTAARAVARSNLLKCALFGNDPNWGRVLSAIGTTDAAFDPDTVDVAMNGVWVCRNGAAGEDREGVDLSGRDVTITVDLKAGGAGGYLRTNDLTTAYVHENSAYST